MDLRNRFSSKPGAKVKQPQGTATTPVLLTPQEMNDRLLVMALPVEIIHIILDFMVEYCQELVRFHGICRRWRLAGLSCPLWDSATICEFSSNYLRVSTFQINPLDLNASPKEVSKWYLGQIHHSAELVRRDEIQMGSGVLLHLFLLIAAFCFDVKITSHVWANIGFFSLYLYLLLLTAVFMDTNMDVYFFIYNHCNYSLFFTQLFMNYGAFLTLLLIHNQLVLHFASFHWGFILFPFTFVIIYYICTIFRLMYTHPLLSPKFLFSRAYLDQLLAENELGIMTLDPPIHITLDISPKISLIYLFLLITFVLTIIFQLSFILYVVFSDNPAIPALEFSYPPYWVKIFPLPLESIGTTLIAFFRITILVSMFLSCFATKTFNIMHFHFLSWLIFCYGCCFIILSFSISNGLTKVKS
jgi:hypothetical protein